MSGATKVLEPAFQGAGQKLGLEIWRIENFLPVPLPKSHYGEFYYGDSYIVLQISLGKGGAYLYDIHFWLGKDTSQDEAGTAAIKTVELDAILGGKAVQYRELQGFESNKFLSYFKPCIIPLEGGVASGFKKPKFEEFETRLYICHGKHAIKMKHVEFARSSLNHDDVFILDTKDKIYQFNGANSNIQERAKALEAVQFFKDKYHEGMCYLAIVDDGKLQAESDSGEFWVLFGGFVPLGRKITTEDDVIPEETPAKLYSITEGKIQEFEGLLSKGSMENNKCYLLDRGVEVYIWFGRLTQLKDRKVACQASEVRSGPFNSVLRSSFQMDLVQKNRALNDYQTEFLKSDNRPKLTRITRVIQGYEPHSFKSHFDSWPPGSAAASTEEGRGKVAAYLKQQDVGVKGANKITPVNEDVPPFLEGSGKIEVWRINGSAKSPVAKEDVGKFYSGDCYIILYTYHCGEKKDDYFLCWWMGKDSIEDDRKMASRLATTMCNSLKGIPVLGRVFQGNEPPQFVAIFQPMVVLKGGLSSGYKKFVEEKGLADETYSTNGLALIEISGTSLHNNKAIQVDGLAEIFIAAIANECDTSHLQKCFGCAVAALGAEEVLRLVPISFIEETLTCSNTWLLPILKKYTFGASLRYFMDHLKLCPNQLQNCNLKLAPFPVKKSVTGKDLQAHAQGLWGLLPAFCRRPTDITESFQSLSKLMLNQLKKDASRHEDIAEALQELVRRNKCKLKRDAAITEALERSSGTLLEDDLMEKIGFTPLSKKDAKRNIKALSLHSNDLLHALITIFLDSPPEYRSNLKKAISCMASISKSSSAKKIFILSLERFPLVKAFIESGDSSDTPQNDMPDSANDDSHWSLSLDLASALAEGADENFLGLIVKLAKQSLQVEDEIVVREAYYTLSCILKDHPLFCSSNLDELVDLMSNLKSPADIASFRNRLSCLRILLVSVLKTSSDVENTKPFRILNYIILALKDSKEEARKVAYDELLKISSCLEESSSANFCELYHKLISMILGYLSGTSPHITSAAVSALSVLVFKEPELCIKVPDLIPSVTNLLQGKAVEVIKSALGFIKVIVSCLEGKDLHNFSSIIMGGLLPWSFVSRHHFRSKVTVIIEILIRKCGFPAVKLVTPERYQPFIRKVSLNRQGKTVSKEADSTDTIQQQNSDASTIGSEKRMRKETDINGGGSRFDRQKRQKQSPGSYPSGKGERPDFRSSRKTNQFNQKKAGIGRKFEKP